MHYSSILHCTIFSSFLSFQSIVIILLLTSVDTSSAHRQMSTSSSSSQLLIPLIHIFNYSSIKEFSKSIVPILQKSLHKGQNGKIGVIGGSIEYTGAPYYSAMSALRFGGDLSMIYSSESAAIPIKSYSPELIVTPFYSDASTSSHDCANIVINQFNKLTSLVIGPGLGRNPFVYDVIAIIVKEAIKKEIPLIIDADGLHFLTVNNNLQLINGYLKCILTPNQVEFNRLVDSSKCLLTSDNEYIYSNLMSLENESNDAVNSDELKAKKVLLLAKLLNGVTILCKGSKDVISNGDSSNSVYLVDMEGCPKRCGGQGDVLAGCLGVASFWGLRAANKAANNIGNLQSYQIQACLLSSAVTKLASEKAYSLKKRGMTSPDVIEQICHVFPEY